MQRLQNLAGAVLRGVHDDEEVIEKPQRVTNERFDDVRVVADHGNASDLHFPHLSGEESIQIHSDTQCSGGFAYNVVLSIQRACPPRS